MTAAAEQDHASHAVWVVGYSGALGRAGRLAMFAQGSLSTTPTGRALGSQMAKWRPVIRNRILGRPAGQATRSFTRRARRAGAARALNRDIRPESLQRSLHSARCRCRHAALAAGDGRDLCGTRMEPCGHFSAPRVVARISGIPIASLSDHRTPVARRNPALATGHRWSVTAEPPWKNNVARTKSSR